MYTYLNSSMKCSTEGGRAPRVTDGSSMRISSVRGLIFCTSLRESNLLFKVLLRLVGFKAILIKLINPLYKDPNPIRLITPQKPKLSSFSLLKTPLNNKIGDCFRDENTRFIHQSSSINNVLDLVYL